MHPEQPHDPYTPYASQHGAPPAPPSDSVYPYAHPPVVVAQAAPTSGWATASLVFGILGVLGGFCLFAIPCLAAVICGHAGLIDTKTGAKGGRGMAVTGLILRYLFIGPAIAVIVMGGIGSVLDTGSTAP